MLFSQRCGSIFLSEQNNTLSTRIILVSDSLQYVSNMHETFCEGIKPVDEIMKVNSSAHILNFCTKYPVNTNNEL